MEYLEKKAFNDYTADEKEALLMHWWHYYGKMMYSLEEFETFHNYVLKDSEIIKDAAVLAYYAGESSQAMLRAMRKGQMDEYLTKVRKDRAESDYRFVYENAEEEFIEEIVNTYNEPENDIPMSEEEVASQLSELFCTKIEVKENAVLSAKKVDEIYRECSFTREEVNMSGEPLVPFVVGEGINVIKTFNADRLESNRKNISEMIAELPRIDEGVSFLALCEDRNKRQWTDLHATMDALVQLGTATGELLFSLPRDMWSVTGGMPYLIRNSEYSKSDLVEHKPAEFQKVKMDYINKIKRKGETTQ